MLLRNQRLNGWNAALNRATKKVVKAKKTRELAVTGLAKGMKLKSDAQSALRSMKDEASDICYDAKVEAGIDDEEEVTE